MLYVDENTLNDLTERMMNACRSAVKDQNGLIVSVSFPNTNFKIVDGMPSMDFRHTRAVVLGCLVAMVGHPMAIAGEVHLSGFDFADENKTGSTN